MFLKLALMGGSPFLRNDFFAFHRRRFQCEFQHLSALKCDSDLLLAEAFPVIFVCHQIAPNAGICLSPPGGLTSLGMVTIGFAKISPIISRFSNMTDPGCF